MNAVTALGIDGCRAGWVATWREPAGPWRIAVFADLRSLATQLSGAELALIDMPIGLPEAVPRECDALARHLLGARACTVFSVPCRSAVYAPDYQSACAENARVLGRRLSRQSFNLLPKVREVDALLREGASLHLYEAHPELCFLALHGAPLAAPKRSLAGRAVRLRLLRPLCPADELLARALGRFRGALAPDDVLDALVLAVAAQSPARLVSLPPAPMHDAEGLPMAILFGPC